MSMTDLLKKIMAPVSKDQPFGERAVDDPGYDFVETQLMKVGSLYHSDVQWQEVEKAVVELLAKRSKDIKLLSYLIQCLQNQAKAERVLLSLQILLGFMQNYWFGCYPIPGDRGALPRRKFFSQIMQRSQKAVAKLELIAGQEELQQQFLLVSSQLMGCAGDLSLPLDNLLVIESQLKNNLQQEKSPANLINSGAPQATTAAENATADLGFDASSEKSAKQSLLKVADYLSMVDAGIALGLRLRRFAIWSGLQTVPDNANDKGVTSLMPPSVDRLSEYQSELAKGASTDLLAKIEQSISLSPFWLDGNRLSAETCMALGQEDWAKVIQEDTQAFVQRLPQLLNMSFRGGVAFAKQETIDWLENNGKNNATVSAGTNSKQKQILDLAESAGLAAAFVSLDDALGSAKEPREQFYLRLLSADLKRKYKLNAMANTEYRLLYQQAETISLSFWEPTLISSLKKKAGIK